MRGRAWRGYANRSGSSVSAAERAEVRLVELTNAIAASTFGAIRIQLMQRTVAVGESMQALGAEPAAQPIAATLVADETPVLLLAEARKQTALLEVIAKQGDRAAEFLVLAALFS